MNAIQLLSSQPWVERLGWTLVHFLWQGVGISALYGAARRGIPRSSSPNTRYILACAALAAMLAVPFATWSLMPPSDAVPVATHLAGRVPSAVPTVTITLPTSMRATVSGRWAGQFLPWVVVIWFGGAMAFWVRLMGGWVAAARMRSRLVRPAPPEWRQILGKLGARIGLSRPVRLLVSGLVEVPAVVGWLRPVVLVPVGALAGLPAEHVEALLIHELAHIRRHDYLVNILQSVAEALLFYHPAVWWVSGHIRAERELCCDDVAALASGDALTYARALTELESYRPSHVNALAANGGSLADRIARLLGQSRPESQTHSGLGAIVSAILLVITAYGLFGQSDGAPRFEVASVKPNNVPDRRLMRVSPRPGGGLIAENAPLRLLIQNAYSVQAFQISGGPGWIQSDGYNIEAKGDGKASRAQIFLKLRSLLGDRFQLKLHRETKEFPVYALSVAKNGLKLQQPKDGSCIAVDPNGSLPPLPPAPGQTTALPCGSPIVAMSPSGVRMQGGKVAMAEFIRVLSMMLGRPVVDRTGFSETFDFRLEFTPDEGVAGLPRPMGPGGDPGSPPPAADAGSPPPIFAAIQEQLGLRLESAKGPVEVLVIDHVERPSQN